jgi:hypothetical protein
MDFEDDVMGRGGRGKNPSVAGIAASPAPPVQMGVPSTWTGRRSARCGGCRTPASSTAARTNAKAAVAEHVERGQQESLLGQDRSPTSASR